MQCLYLSNLVKLLTNYKQCTKKFILHMGACSQLCKYEFFCIVRQHDMSMKQSGMRITLLVHDMSMKHSGMRITLLVHLGYLNILTIIQIIVESFLFYKFFVISLFNYISVFHYQYYICLTYC